MGVWLRVLGLVAIAAVAAIAIASPLAHAASCSNSNQNSYAKVYATAYYSYGYGSAWGKVVMTKGSGYAVIEFYKDYHRVAVFHQYLGPGQTYSQTYSTAAKRMVGVYVDADVVSGSSVSTYVAATQYFCQY